MHSQAQTVEEYLTELPDDRRLAITQLRQIILDHLPSGYQETMNWGMMCYEVPLSVYPDTYNKKPLIYAALASQKAHMAIYLTCIYSKLELREWFEQGFQAAGKKLNAGASCVRFKTLDALPLNVIGAAIAAVPMDVFIAEEKQRRAHPTSL